MTIIQVMLQRRCISGDRLLAIGVEVNDNPKIDWYELTFFVRGFSREYI